MDNLISVFIGVLIAVIILYNVVLPTYNPLIYNTTTVAGGAPNLTAQNVSLSAVLPTLLVTNTNNLRCKDNVLLGWAKWKI